MMNKKRIIGVDLGDKRTGVAVTDPTGILAGGIEMIVSSGMTDCAKKIAAFVEKYEAGEIVIGNPINMNGTRGESVKKTEKFAEILDTIVNAGNGEKNIKITLFDERLSSSLAHTYMNETGISGKSRKAKIDILSAQIILQNYIDSLKKDHFN